MEANKESSKQPAYESPKKRVSVFSLVALCLGTIACLICWIPLLGFAGLPVAFIGLFFGIAGITVAIRTKHYSIGLPITGTAISAVAILIFVVVTGITIMRVTHSVEAEFSRRGSDTRWQKYTETRQNPYRELTLPHRRVDLHFAVSPDRKKGLCGDYSSSFHLIDMNSGNRLMTFESHLESESLQCAAFSSDGKRAVAGGGDTKDLGFSDRLRGKHSEENWILSFWDLVSGKQIGHAEGQDDFIISAAYSPVDNKAISSGIKGDILLWDLEKMKVLKTFVGHSSGMRRNCLVWSQDGKTFLSGNWDGSIRLWDVQTGKEVAHLQAGYGRVMSLALSPDGKYALSSYLNGPNQPVILWDLEDQREINRFGVPGRPRYADQGLEVASVAFSPDGKTALFGLFFGTVIWWDLNEWRQIAMNRLHEDKLTFVAFSADGKSSISAGWDTDTYTENAKVKFWQLPDRNRIKEKK